MLTPTVIAVPVFATLIAVERYYSFRMRSKEYDESIDTWTNIFVGLMSVVWGFVFGLGSGLIYQWCYELAPYKFPADAWWSWALLFFADDFAYYWFHRISHESRLFWNFHVVHHSSRHYNLSVAVRQSWFSGLTHWIFYAPLMLLGFSPWMFLTVHGLNLIYQFWIHTRFIDRLGFLENIINTPSHHRVHHGVNNEYLDKNYAGVLIIWDRMFGTFTEEKEEPAYGITTQLSSFNPLWINTHGWAEMWHAMKTRGTLLGKLRCMFASPNMNLPKRSI
jgi:sterol desaturase/sphingolipid hydroxylase (fatty acid hydroxylase superfamily)